MVLNYNRASKVLKSLLVDYGMADKEEFKKEAIKAGLYVSETLDEEPGNVKFYYIHLKGKEIRATIRFSIKESKRERDLTGLISSLEELLNKTFEFKRLSKYISDGIVVSVGDRELDLIYKKDKVSNELNRIILRYTKDQV